MTDEFNVDFTQSSLFKSQPESIDFSQSLLFNSGSVDSGNVDSVTDSGNVNSATDSVTDSAQNTSIDSTSKKIKLLNGKTIELKRKTHRFNDTDIYSENDMNLMDMDSLFQKAKEREAYRQNFDQVIEHNPPKINTKSNMIWTEKYRPKRYLELCSAGNDKLYRQVSHWLKKWFSIVHGEEPENLENTDSLGRPFRKFLLINGPSGIGKTATAHIIARQLGYNVEELNAANSMDTLPQASGTGGFGNVAAALRLKIQNALTTNTITSQGKPTCLIIDEVDTAINSSEIIKVLHQLNQADQRALAKLHNKSDNNNNGKKRKSNDFLLNRPIICIANDIYTSNSRSYGGYSLDTLRSLSEIITFRKPTMQKTMSGSVSGGKSLRSVKEYLKWISDNEKLGLDYQQIGEIAEVCEGDIRASINHLQFCGRKIDSTSSFNMENSIKDSQISWFKLVDMLFKRDAQSTKDDDFNNLMRLFMDDGSGASTNSSNNLDKVIRACFNRYLDAVHYQDDSLIRPGELSDWFDFYDKLGGYNDIPQYVSLVNLKIWSLFSEINPQKNGQSLIPDARAIEFSCNDSINRNKAILTSFIDNIPITMRRGFENNHAALLYFVPFLHDIVFPALQSSGGGSSVQIKLKMTLSDFDKRCLERAASLVKDFGLNLESVRDNDTNQLLLETSPNLDSLSFYDCDFLPTPFTTTYKQIQQKRRWLFPMLQGEIERLSLDSSPIITTEKKRSLDSKSDEPKAAKKLKISSSIDFFKGQYDDISTQIQNQNDPVDHEFSRIWVKYNEGFSNAVRKNIGWNDLWLP